MATTSKGLAKQKSSMMFREITPPHGWKEDSDFHYLRLTLPGFEAKDVHLRVDKYGHLVVRGDKQVSDHKYISFEETFDVPKNADIENADGLFEDNQIYCVTIPKINGGRRTGHAITIPKLDNYQNKHKPHEITEKPHGIGNNPLQVIRADKSRKKIGFFIAVLILLLIIAVALIIKFRLVHK